MLRPTPRLIWSSACVACLGAVAGALFWPTQDIPRLSPLIDPQTPDFASASAGLTASATAPTSRTEPTDTAQEQSSDEAPNEDRTRPDSAGETVRDAVADVSWRADSTGRDLSQAPWRAYWGLTNRETTAVPVPPTLPTTYHRASKGGGEQASTQKNFGRFLRTDAGSGRAFSPQKAPRRIADLQRRMRADRTSTTETKKTPHVPIHQTGRNMTASLGRTPGIQQGRFMRTETGSRAKAEHKINAEPKNKALKPPRLRPVLLSKVLGINAIRPPKTKLNAPDFSRLAHDIPKAGPDGKPMSLSAADVKALEALRPPGKAAADCHKPGRHWHYGPEPAYHEGQAWGLQHDGGWLWLKKSGQNWWAWTSPQEPTWLWHKEHWWWRSDGIWFMLHEGEVWGYRLFDERRAEGLVHPGTGTQMEYSADGQRVAMITPGDGAWLFDARSGAVLERWTEAQMPAKIKPHAPRALSLPP